MKYTKIKKGIDLAGTEFNGDINTKYAKVNGESFTKYLLKRK